MTKLQRLHAEYGQSPWLDNITHGYLRDGTLARMVGDGIPGVAANPTIFAKAIGGSPNDHERFSPPSGRAVGWRMPTWRRSSPTSPTHAPPWGQCSTPVAIRSVRPDDSNPS